MATEKIFILFIILLSMVGTKALAYDIAVKNADGVTIYYNYINSGEELEVTRCNGGDYSGSVVIPEEVTYDNMTRKVTSIGIWAFQNCSDLTSISIPNSIKSIGSYAFYYCTGLTSISIPDSVTDIDIFTFYGCTGLTSISIPDSVTYIGNSVFYDCSGLTSVSIPNSMKYIGSHAFYGCTGLTSVHINDIAAWCKITFGDYEGNPLYYANHLYLNGEEILDLVIPDSVTSIASVVFYGCTDLTSVSIPNSVESIGGKAFSGCTGLASVHINDIATWCKISFGDYEGNPLYYAHHLYLNGEEILDLVIPDGVTSIASAAFNHCTDLTSISIPKSMTSISSNAFNGCI